MKFHIPKFKTGDIVYFKISDVEIVQCSVEYIKIHKFKESPTYYLSGWTTSFDENEIFGSVEEIKINEQ